MFLPTTKEEMQKLGWESLDVIIVTGDTYIDSPFIGAAAIGRTLHTAGYRVGIIAQPSIGDGADIRRLGEPQLFWGITAGATDSMVANYTALKKRRRTDDFTPGGTNDRRPDRATIVYANLVRRYFKQTRPIVLGGIEASLRRVAHYDYWDDAIRRSILFDAKADLLVYGMGEQAVLELARRMSAGEDVSAVRGTCCIADAARADAVELPAYETVAADKGELARMFRLFCGNADPVTAHALVQKHGDRWLVQNPPSPLMSGDELDALHEMGYTRQVHPYYQRLGAVRAQDTIRFSVTTHRGCYGECNFCAIAVHQGRTVTSRSEGSILREVRALAALPGFKGVVTDVGGPTANMYAIECALKPSSGACPAKRCLTPRICRQLPVDHRPQTELLRKVRGIEGVKSAYVASGLRVDMIVEDKRHGMQYLRELVRHHVSGQLKVAPEHVVDAVLRRMGKPGVRVLARFREAFARINGEEGKRQFLTYYLIAAHPGCELRDMVTLQGFASSELHTHPEQVQIFTPLPSTYSTLMYYTGIDPFTGAEIFVERSPAGKARQKEAVVGGASRGRPAARRGAPRAPRRG
jgi:uncharacterized radical SAM protein YgiQ